MALVAVGVGAIIVQSQWLFHAIKWAGIAYLVFLGVQSLRSAVLRQELADRTTGASAASWSRGFRQGFLCNITNPKMFVFYLSLLPQFVNPEASVWTWLLHAWALPFIGSVWLLAVSALAGSVRSRLLQPLARRLLDGVAGVALLGFGTKLALDH